jgi:hypothetical protein
MVCNDDVFFYTVGRSLPTGLVRGGLVHKFLKLSLLPVAALGVACGQGESSNDSALNAELKRDLEAASAASVELASTARDYQQTRVVSAIESPRASAPVRRRNVRRPVAVPAAALEDETSKTPDPAPETKVEIAEPEPAPAEAPAPSVDTPTNVAVTPRPTPVGSAPASTEVGRGGSGGGSGGGGLGGIGEAIGTVIGVVIVRGGTGGVDHCDPRTDRRPTNGPLALPNPRYPAGAGVPIAVNDRRPRFPRGR